MLNKNRIMDIRRALAFDECFEKDFFSVCPIDNLRNSIFYKHRKTLNAAHCLDFSCLSSEEMAELKQLTKEAVEWEKPWWGIV